jgi:hypothetical protein
MSIENAIVGLSRAIRAEGASRWPHGRARARRTEVPVAL